MSYPLVDSDEKTKKIPVRIRNGKLFLLFDEQIEILPLIEENAIADIIIPDYSIKTKEYDQLFSKEININFLNKDTELYVRLIIPGSNYWKSDVSQKLRDISLEEINYILKVNEVVRKKSSTLFVDNSCFVKIILMEELRLQYRGTKSSRLNSCGIAIPILRVNAESLNHAYTLLSQKFQTHRIAHTGNVFTHFYFLDKDSDQFRDLDSLRQKRESEMNIELLNKFRSTPPEQNIIKQESLFSENKK